MSTLSNVHPSEGGKKPSYAGLALGVSPKAQGSDTGVSVRYAQTSDRQWYILRATYNRIDKAKDIIDAERAEIYVPMCYSTKIINGKNRRIKRPLIPNIVFIYTTEEYIKSLVEHNPRNGILNYYYNHFITDEFDKNPPLTVKYNEMMNFIRATSIDNEHVMIVDADQCHYKNGDMVTIVDGAFKGVRGRVARVAGQQRVVIELPGICLVATAYIPTAFIRKS